MSVKEEKNNISKMFSKIVQYCYDKPFIGYLLLICLVFWPLSLGIYALQYDAVDVYLPWRFFGSEVLQNGDVPLWNPFQDGGYPFYADHQYSIWNPEFFIVSIFGRYNAYTIQALYLCYLVLGGLGFRYLLKELGISLKVAFYGGILFMLSGIMVGHAQSVISILGAVWLPWSLGAYIRLLKDNFRIKDILRCIICLFLMLAAGYQAVSIMLFYVLLALGLHHLIGLIKNKDWKKVKRFVAAHISLGLFIGVLLLGTILSLIEIAPYLTRLSGVSIADTQKSIFHPKALLSVLYPMASVKQEITGMSVTTLNVFSGTVSLFFLFFVKKYYKKKHSPQLLVLLVFGIIYGLASMGPHTFVQPLFAKYVPGCDLFFYAVFYSYFTWIALLILVCIGFEYFLKEGKVKYIMYFFGSIILIYGVSVIVSWDAWNEIGEKWTPNWSVTFRELSKKAAVLVQSIVHLSIVAVFVAIYFFTRHKKALLSIFLITELAVISQLNIPISGHGTTRTASIDNYLATKKSGFSLLNEHENLSKSEKEGQYGSIWRNHGNFTNLPALNGWTSFHLAAREETYVNHTEMTEELLDKPFVYIKSGEGSAKLIEFEPNQFKIQFRSAKNGDTLVIQQAKYPGWEAKVNGQKTEIFKGNVFEQLIPVSGNGTVSMNFKNDSIRILFYVTHLGFILLLIVFMLMAWKPTRKIIPYSFALLAIIFVSVRLRQFANTEKQNTSMELSNGETPLIKFAARLNEENKENIFKTVMGTTAPEVILNEQALDLDFDVLAILNNKFKNTEVLELTSTATKLAFFEERLLVEKEITTMDSTLIYVNNTEHLNWPKLNSDMRVLTAGITVEEMEASQEVILVVEVVKHGTRSFYKTHKLNPYEYNGERFVRKGILLPEMSSSDELKVYLWNNSSKPFTFSTFKLNFIDLSR